MIRRRRLTNSEFEEVERLAQSTGIPLDQCPTCGSTMTDDVRRLGSYRYHDEVHQCDCYEQMDLRVAYLAANIPDQYMRLDWETFDQQPVKKQVAEYLFHRQSARVNGVGLEFYGKSLGAGKTFCATYVGKELVKHGEHVYFTDFRTMVSAFTEEDRDLAERIQSTPWVILDEIVPSWTDAQHELYAARLETTIRHRTNFNLPTIITTNLPPEELDKEYARVYSLLSAKQIRIEIEGDDARKQKIALENMTLVANGEVKPIT